MAALRDVWSRLTKDRSQYPNQSSTDDKDVDLAPQQADNLVRTQLALANPFYLDKEAFRVVGIVDESLISHRVHEALVKHAIISGAPAPGEPKWELGEAARPPVNTHAITSNFHQQMFLVGYYAQRKLVSLLFFWEAECERLKTLGQEERRLQTELQETGDEDQRKQIELALKAVEVKKKLLPSQRSEPTANVTTGVTDTLPAYSAGQAEN